MLAVAKLSGESIRVPRRLWGEVAVLALFQHRRLERAGAVRRRSAAGRTQRDHRLHDADVDRAVLARAAARAAQPAQARRASRWAWSGMALLLGDDIRQLQRAPTAALFILGASICWAFGTVLLRKWNPPLPQNALSGWMMLLGWVPIALLAPLVAPGPMPELTGRGVVRDPLQHLPRRHARALGVVHAGAHAAGRGLVDGVAAGADRRRLRRHAGAGRATRPGGVDGAGAGALRDDRRALARPRGEADRAGAKRVRLARAAKARKARRRSTSIGRVRAMPCHSHAGLRWVGKASLTDCRLDADLNLDAPRPNGGSWPLVVAAIDEATGDPTTPPGIQPTPPQPHDIVPLPMAAGTSCRPP